MELNRVCPICGNKEGEDLKEIRMILQQGNPLPESYHVVSCGKCGFTYADVGCSQREYNIYYNEFNIHTNALKVENIEMGDMHQKFLDIISQAGILQEAKILDIGCGGGELLCFLKEKGYSNICGLDPSAKSIEKLHALGIQGEIGNLFDKVKDNLKNSFDVVASTGVIEHIYDLPGYLEQLQQYIKSDGYLYLLAPAVESFTKFPLPVAAYFNHEHINYFSIFSMDNLMWQYGLSRVNEDVYSKHKDEMFLVALYKKIGRDNPIKKDTISSQTIKEYFCLKTAEPHHNEIQKLCERDAKVIVFGCGSYSMQILAEYPKLLEKVEFFVDNNREKAGMLFCGKPVKGTDALEKAGHNAVIAVCSMRSSGEIVRQLEDMQIKNEIVIL